MEWRSAYSCGPAIKNFVLRKSTAHGKKQGNAMNTFLLLSIKAITNQAGGWTANKVQINMYCYEKRRFFLNCILVYNDDKRA